MKKKKNWKGWAAKAVWGVDVFDQNQREISQIWRTINDSGSHQWLWVPSIFLECRVPGVVPCLIRSLSIRVAWSPSIISIYHTPVISSHDWGTIFSCWLFAREFEIFMGSERRASVPHLHEEQLAKKRLDWGGAETKSDLNFVKRIVLKFEMVKNVTLVG